MMHSEYQYKPQVLPLGVEYSRKKSDRMSWIPVTVSKEGRLFPLEYHGSAHVHSLAGADAIACIPAGVKEIKSGENLNVRFI
jgi:molybdopterin molybdotransferase